MGKKRTRKTKTSTSSRRSVSKENLVARTAAERLFDKLKAKKAGKPVSTLIVNPDTENLRKAPYVRVTF